MYTCIYGEIVNFRLLDYVGRINLLIDECASCCGLSGVFFEGKLASRAN